MRAKFCCAHNSVRVFSSRTVADDEIVPYDVYHFVKIVENISRQPSTLASGSLFSEKEESFLKFTATVRECSTGKKEALHRLFHTSGLARVPSTSSAEDQIKQALHTFFIGHISELISESGPCLYSLCGTAGLSEVSHQALYIKNNIGKFLGLDHNMKFDIYSYNLEDFLVVMPKDKMLEILSAHMRPSELLFRLQRFIKDRINLQPGASPEQIVAANTFRVHLASILTVDGDFRKEQVKSDPLRGFDLKPNLNLSLP